MRRVLRGVEDERVPTKRRGLSAKFVTGVVAVLVLGGLGTWALDVWTDRALETTEKNSTGWTPGVTPSWMAEHLGVTVPAGAGDRHAGYYRTSRYDIGALTFTLAEEEAQAFLADILPRGASLRAEPHPVGSGLEQADFGQFGAAEPTRLHSGLRTGDPACPDDQEPAAEQELAYCAELYVHSERPGRLRVYLRAVIEPQISPLPTAGG